MDALRSLPTRIRALPAGRLDALLGALVLVDGVIEVLTLSRLHGLDRVALGLGAATAIAIAVALRRRLPITAVTLGWGTMLAADQIGPELVDNVAGPYFANMLIRLGIGPADELVDIQIGDRSLALTPSRPRRHSSSRSPS